MPGRLAVCTLLSRKMRRRRSRSGCGKVGSAFLSTFPQPAFDFLRIFTGFLWMPDYFYRKILALSQRWPIETFYQDGKELLGLDEYLMRNAEAIGKHWCLVFVAYSLLHLDCLPPSLAQGDLPIKSIGEACRQQAQALIEKLILYTHERLQQGHEMQAIFTDLFAKQRAATIALAV